MPTSNRLDSLTVKDEQFCRRFANTFFFEEFTGKKLERILRIWGDFFIQMQDPLNSNRTISLLKSNKNELDQDLVKAIEIMTLGDLGLLDKILRNAARNRLKDKLREVYQKTLKALETEERLLKISAKTILKNTKIDKLTVEALQGIYPRSETALS